MIRLLPVLCLLLACLEARAAFRSAVHDFEAETIAEGLRRPWALQFLPGGDFLVTQRPGRLSRVARDGSVADVSGLPPVAAVGQGGLLDVRLDPGFASNRRLYLCYAGRGAGGFGTELAAAELAGGRLAGVRVLFRAEPKSGGGRHFGCRVAFDLEGRLYLSLGERGRRANSQDLSTHPGGVVRLNRDGSIPRDNPFVDRPGARPETFTYGNRNPQGMARHPRTGAIWMHEHGPQGGDELNVVYAGANYGWPTVTHGADYGTGARIGIGTHAPGMTQPLHHWTPSIAPSGIAFYRGDAFPRWNGSLFVGSLKFRLLVRLELDGARVVREERMLQGRFGRIRDVRVGPDGLVYLLTDEHDGRLIRLKPVGG